MLNECCACKNLNWILFKNKTRSKSENKSFCLGFFTKYFCQIIQCIINNSISRFIS